MRSKLITIICALTFSGAVTAAYFQYENHAHTEFNAPLLGHSGGLDANGGHNCSEKSKQKGLCTGYHKHR